MADIFISYSKAERKLTERLAAVFERQGFTVWWDASLLSGEDYRKVILRELDAAKAVVVIWTPNSITSDWVISEAERATHGGKLVPLRTASVSPRDIPPPFGTRHTELVDNHAAVLDAVRRLGVEKASTGTADRRAQPGGAADASAPAGGTSWREIAIALLVGASLMVGGAYLASKPTPKMRGPSEHKAFTQPDAK